MRQPPAARIRGTAAVKHSFRLLLLWGCRRGTSWAARTPGTTASRSESAKAAAAEQYAQPSANVLLLVGGQNGVNTRRGLGAISGELLLQIRDLLREGVNLPGVVVLDRLDQALAKIGKLLPQRRCHHLGLLQVGMNLILLRGVQLQHAGQHLFHACFRIRRSGRSAPGAICRSLRLALPKRERP